MLGIEKFWLKAVRGWIESPPAFFRRTFWHGVFRISSEPGDDSKRVYLSFDDGPIPEATPWVLDTLDRFGVKATFFMVGDNVRKYPELYREVVARGHKVGNHTMHHIHGSRRFTHNYVRDVLEAAKYIDSDLFRPPHGWMRFGQKEMLHRLNYKIIMYDVVTRDYSRWLTGGDVLENVKRYVRPGSIVVFHDSIKSRKRLQVALPAALQWLKDEGYEFALIPSDKSTSK